MEFSWVLKKKQVEIPRVNLKWRGIPRGVIEKKIVWKEFPWVLVFAGIRDVATAILAGNNPFLIRIITQNKKRFITQPKHSIFW